MTRTKNARCCALTPSGERCANPSSRGGFIHCRAHRLAAMRVVLTRLVLDRSGPTVVRGAREAIRRAVERMEGEGDYRDGTMERHASRIVKGRA